MLTDLSDPELLPFASDLSLVRAFCSSVIDYSSSLIISISYIFPLARSPYVLDRSSGPSLCQTVTGNENVMIVFLDLVENPAHAGLSCTLTNPVTTLNPADASNSFPTGSQSMAKRGVFCCRMEGEEEDRVSVLKM